MNIMQNYLELKIKKNTKLEFFKVLKNYRSNNNSDQKFILKEVKI